MQKSENNLVIFLFLGKYLEYKIQVSKGKKIQIFNYGNCKRDFTYVDDIVEGVQRVMHKAPERSQLIAQSPKPKTSLTIIIKRL